MGGSDQSDPFDLSPAELEALANDSYDDEDIDFQESYDEDLGLEPADELASGTESAQTDPFFSGAAMPEPTVQEEDEPEDIFAQVAETPPPPPPAPAAKGGDEGEDEGESPSPQAKDSTAPATLDEKAAHDDSDFSQVAETTESASGAQQTLFGETIATSSVEDPGLKSTDTNFSKLRYGFVDPIVRYFQDLEETILNELTDEQEGTQQDFDPGTIPAVVAYDNLHFDENSVHQGLAFSLQLQDFFTEKIDDHEFNVLRSVYSFYHNQNELLEKVKLLFLGDIKVKEKITRLYGQKALGTYKVVKVLIETKGLYTHLAEEDVRLVHQKLYDYATRPLKAFRGLLPRSLRKKYPWDGRSWERSLHQIVKKEPSLFEKNLDYAEVSERFREFIFSLYGDPLVLDYLHWKNRYLIYWMHESLHQLDVEGINSGRFKKPRYSLLKLKAYQHLERLVSEITTYNRPLDKAKMLKKSSYSTFSSDDGFRQDVSDPVKQALHRAREAERMLLESLTVTQTALLAEKIHMEIREAFKDDPGTQELPVAARPAPVQFASEQKREQMTMKAAVKVQAEHARKELKALGGDFLKALSGVAEKLKIVRPAKTKPQEEAVEVVHDYIPRAEGNSGLPLEPVKPDWIGYGREYRNSIYEHTLPTLQRRFFEYGEFKLHLFEDYLRLVDSVLEYYHELGYKLVMVHTWKQSAKKEEKQINDEVVYLRMDEYTFLALGKSRFGSSDELKPYFQIYSIQPTREYRGASKTIDYSKKVDDKVYKYESIESSSQLRPYLYECLIDVIDSLPDNIRDQHQNFLKHAYRFLEEQAS